MGKVQITKEKLDQWIKDYRWMINTVEQLQMEFGYKGAKIAQYGIEATLPKASGQTSDVVFAEVVRRNKHLKRINEYIYKIQEVQKRVDKVTEPREAEVLYWLLEGKSMRWIGQHMALSHVSIKNIKESIIESMLK
ncbi:helix-turn-helix transcriptional regulator [Ureibacillus suwonensis]|uniref:Helix-turn-helix transcriptional regulator n=1 Tax=Ureibacillus suwonensis TaxID=313007 RepID=A0ABW0RDZ2_9BACL